MRSKNYFEPKEFEQKLLHEVEQKLLPLFPEKLEQFRAESTPIEQLYLSHPSEDFSLRLRETVANGELIYTATLKDSGVQTPAGLDRLEVETPITPELYHYYKDAYQTRGELVSIKKLRAEPMPNIAVDFYEDGHVHVESEHPMSLKQFIDTYDFDHELIDMSGEKNLDNQWRAHLDFRREHGGHEALVPKPELDTETIVHEILSGRAEKSQTVISINGRSGSGKSTIVREIQEKLKSYNLSSEIVSTDDYHRGDTWLRAHNNGAPWQDWDDPIVYDTETMSHDLQQVVGGESIPRRRIDFTDVEPSYSGMIEPSEVVIIEGIRASSPEITRHVERSYDVPTPPATCYGRRLLRDMRERPQFADPQASLRYMLEFAEPAWRKNN